MREFPGKSSGGQGIRTTCEIPGETEKTQNRETRRTLNSQLPNIEAQSRDALSDLIGLWPSLSLATQNRIHAIAQAEAASDARNASDKRGAK